MPLVKDRNGLLKLLQVALLQSIPVMAGKDGFEEIFDLQVQRIRTRYRRGGPQIIVQVPNKMHEAFLLRTWHRIVPTIEIGDQSSVIIFQHFLDNRTFASLGEFKKHMGPICKDPHVVIIPLNAESCLINVNKRTLQEPLQIQLFCGRIIEGEIPNDSL